MLAGAVHQPVDLALGEVVPLDCQVYDAWCALFGCRFHADKPCLPVPYCIGYTSCLHSRGAAARTVFAMQDGGTGTGARHEAAAPPGRGDFLVSNFHPGLIPGNLVRNDFRRWGGLGGEWGGLFLDYLLGKNYRRRDRNHLVPPEAGCMQRSPAVLRCAILGRKHGRDRLITLLGGAASWPLAARERSASPAAQRVSIRTLRPSIQPNCCSPRANAVTHRGAGAPRERGCSAWSVSVATRPILE